MSHRLSLLCPVDCSDASLGALHYAAAISHRTGAALTILMVEEPEITEAAARLGTAEAGVHSTSELRRFCAPTIDAQVIAVTFEVRRGQPAVEIRAAALAGGHSLIVMGTHGRRGAGKWLLGTVAERVLRETTIPVLLVPHDPGSLSFAQLAKLASPILVPVDFTAGSGSQIEVASRAAVNLGAEMIVGHVVAPLNAALPSGIDPTEIWNERHRRAWQGLRTMVDGLDSVPPAHMFVADGDPVDEIVRWVRHHHAGLLVMSLHNDPGGPARMGSITYRTIATAKVLTLALPPSLPRQWPSIGDTP